MKFNPFVKDTYRIGTFKYTVPVTGHYLVSAKVISCIPTGKFETVKNPNRKWYMFWEPRMITREIMECVHHDGGVQVQFLYKGVEIDSAIQPWRVDSGN
jgi:hypothetical protein